MGGYGAIAAMMGGMMASMMMAALAALAGKAMMTSLLALMMAAFAAMRGGGGGGGSKTYEVITKPVVSHIDTHSSEVQHEHHGHYHKRSLEWAGDEGSAQEQKILNKEKGEERHENQKRLEDKLVYFKKRPEVEEANYKEYSIDQDYNLKGSPGTTSEDREKNPFNVSSDEEVLPKKRSVDFDFSGTIPSSQERNSEIQRAEQNYDRFKRGLIHSLPSMSTLQSSLSSDDTKDPPLGHPRQNHKEYRRNTDDDLLMAFGLFR